MKTPEINAEQSGFLRFGGARMAMLDIEAGFWSIRRQLEALVGSQLANNTLHQAGVNGGASFAESMGMAKDHVEQGRLFKSCVQAYQAAGFGRFEIEESQWPIGKVLIRAQNTIEAWMMQQHNQKVDNPICAYTAGVLVGFINVICNQKDIVCIEHSCQALGDETCVFELLPFSQASDRQVVAFNPDPKLGHQVNLLEMLFERMPMGIAVIGRDFRLVRCNPTWATFIEKYTPSEAIQVVPGSCIFDLEPGTEEILTPLFDKVFKGETIRQDSIRIELGGIESFWDVVLSPLYEKGQVVGLLNVSIDATERLRAEKRLEETLAHLSESESILRSVVENAQHFAIYRVEIDPSNPYLGKVVLVSPSVRELTGIEDPYCFEKWFENLHPDDYDRIIEANRRSFETGTTYNQQARFFNVRENRWRWVQTISNPGFNAAGHVTHFDGMVIDLTNQKEAELALQEINASLEQRIAERTHDVNQKREIAESLRDIIGMINSNLPQEEFLERAVKLAAQRLGAAACVLHHFDFDGQTISQLASFGMSGIFNESHVRPFDMLKFSGGDDYFQATIQSQPTYTNYPPLPKRVNEIIQNPTIPDEIKAERIALRQRFAGALSTPIFIQDKVYGGMVFYYVEPQDFSTEQVQLAMTFADQVAVALENARLHQQEQQRQRELQMLLDVAAAANRSLDLDETLIATLDLLRNLINASRAGVMLRNEETGKLEERMLRPEQKISSEDLSQITTACEAVVTSGEPLYVIPDSERGFVEPGVLLPLRIRDRILGVLVIIGAEGERFDPEKQALFNSIADQLGLAVEKARLYGQAKQAAITTERNRLARDLHDAVTQTLFSASLIADVLPKIWERNPETGKQKLEELKTLTRGALSEMRTLLLELRPAVLVEMDLGELLRHLANAFTGRTRIPVTLTLDGQVDPSPDIKEVFYRVAQEALNNISKHAKATQAAIYLKRQEKRVEIRIQDNGKGFDQQSISSDNLGLGIMRERAAAIGAKFTIESQIGEGASIKLIWQEELE